MAAQKTTLGNLVQQLGLTLPAASDAEIIIHSLKPLQHAQKGELSFLDNPKYAASAKITGASAVFIHADNAHLLPEGVAAILTATPYVAFAQSLALLYPPELKAGIHPTAVVEEGGDY